jgi:hypothetical protein
MIGAKTDDSPPYSNFYGVWGGKWALWGGGAVKLSGKATFNLQLSADGQRNFAAVANIAFKLADGLTVTPEIGFYDNFDASDSRIGGFMRIQKDF